MTTPASPPPAPSPPYGVLRAPREILFAPGARHAVGRIVSDLGGRAFVCSDPVIAASSTFDQAISRITETGVAVTVFTDVEPELPVASVAVAVEAARRTNPDVIVGFGGGSVLDLAKLVALGLVTEAPLADFYGENLVPAGILPVVAIPTTAGTGSEVTPVAVVADPTRALKVGISSPHLIPVAAIVDPELTLSCPPAVTAFSGIDALTHAIESYSARTQNLDLSRTLPVFVGANRLSACLGLEAAGFIGPNLVTAVGDGSDISARTAMAYGSMLAGMAFGAGGTHLSHAIQYPIGDATHTPHGLGVGLLLPYVMEACLPTAAAQFARIGQAMGVVDADLDTESAAVTTIRFVADLRLRIGVPHTLAQIGLGAPELPRIIDQASTVGRLVNNAPVTAAADLIAPIVERAWAGTSDIFPTTQEVGART